MRSVVLYRILVICSRISQRAKKNSILSNKCRKSYYHQDYGLDRGGSEVVYKISLFSARCSKSVDTSLFCFGVPISLRASFFATEQPFFFANRDLIFRTIIVRQQRSRNITADLANEMHLVLTAL